MEITVGVQGDVVILNPKGNLIAATVDAFREQWESLIEKGFLYIVLNLSNVCFMDSSGLSACIALYNCLKTKSGKLVIASPTQAVRKILRITRTDRKFVVSEHEIEGLELIREQTIT